MKKKRRKQRLKTRKTTNTFIVFDHMPRLRNWKEDSNQDFIRALKDKKHSTTNPKLQRGVEILIGTVACLTMEFITTEI